MYVSSDAVATQNWKSHFRQEKETEMGKNWKKLQYKSKDKEVKKSTKKKKKEKDNGDWLSLLDKLIQTRWKVL